MLAAAAGASLRALRAGCAVRSAEPAVARASVRRTVPAAKPASAVAAAEPATPPAIAATAAVTAARAEPTAEPAAAATAPADRAACGVLHADAMPDSEASVVLLWCGQCYWRLQVSYARTKNTPLHTTG